MFISSCQETNIKSCKTFISGNSICSYSGVSVSNMKSSTWIIDWCCYIKSFFTQKELPLILIGIFYLNLCIKKMTRISNGIPIEKSDKRLPQNILLQYTKFQSNTKYFYSPYDTTEVLQCQIFHTFN